MSEKTPAELRDAFEALQKENKKLAAENETLHKTNRSLQAANAFREAALAPDLADLFVAAVPDGDITVDAAKEFAQKYGIAPKADEGSADENEETEEIVEDQRSGLANIARAGSGAGTSGQATGGAKLVTRDEFLRMQQTDPAAAQQALAEGRVQLRTDNPYVSGPAVLTGDNPFRARQGVSSDE